MSVSRETNALLDRYVELLLQWQKKINLIGPSTVEDVWERHIADSIQCFDLAPNARHWVDLGSGAGFPGLVVAIRMTGHGGLVELVESNGKKCSFLRTVARELKLRELGVEVRIHNDRIENVMGNLAKPDVISARALSSLDQLLGFTDGILTGACIGIFPKGRGWREEHMAAAVNWQYELETHASQTDDDAAILEIRNARRIADAPAT